ncbi:hypothetical protein HN695_04505, partial [Candidatus Woesearchaeota archaeon]|nr:hypothetical protein [Candidatus Woesearchaeota archaeon]MBT5271837.1 hypothetical protein [Candidatus Woesearchaeota archaeon]MBT6040289.1 hypothetical protein [Candidatus Woesearchaeota archaeon]MBT6337325.1 hypothetical protein [Candidatus Woesearchaeota archaeon]MBT7927573.1 hypothetical protein [Candidatus Woesearchaeota archaeon]
MKQRINKTTGVGFILLVLIVAVVFHIGLREDITFSGFNLGGNLITGMAFVDQNPDVEVRIIDVDLHDQYGYATGHHDITKREDNLFDVTLSSSPGIPGLVHVGETPEAIVEIYGINSHNESLELKTIIDTLDEDDERFGFIKTAVFASDTVEIESASLTLPKTHNVEYIMRCDEFDKEEFECVDLHGWQETNTPFVDNGNTISFSVTHFTAYAGGGSNETNIANLTIWDNSDLGEFHGNQEMFTYEEVEFFANYSMENGSAIGKETDGEGVNCVINFSNGDSDEMNYIGAYDLYEFDNTFEEAGDYDYNISCDGSLLGYVPLNIMDNITIYASINQTNQTNVTNVTSLVIWDSTDEGVFRGDEEKYILDEVEFFANYTMPNGSLIGGNVSGDNVTCLISFNDSINNEMDFVAAHQLYEYERTFLSEDEFEYNISCNGSLLGYDVFNETDNVTIFGFGGPPVSLDGLCPGVGQTWVVNESYILNSSAACDVIIVNNSATLTVNGDYALTAINLTVDIGATISADEKGCGSSQSPDDENNCSSQGTGAGVGEGKDGIYHEAGGGGGYGGDGGNGDSGYAGGSDYGSALRPSHFGSGGGTSGNAGVGGSGGGNLRIIVTDTFNLSGVVTADGGAGGTTCSYYAAGGGSGGSIWVSSIVLTGVGNFSADGGAGGDCSAADGAGGSGGRIAVYFDDGGLNDFSASTVTGGSGPGSATDGEEGTLLFVDKDDNNAWIDEGMEFNVTDYASDGSFKASQNVNFSFNNLTLLGSLLRLEMTGVINVGNFTIDEATLIFDGDPSEQNISFVYKGGEVWTEDAFNISESFNVNRLTFTDYEMVSFKSLTSGYELTDDTWEADWFDIDVANLSIDAGSSITTNANGCGNSQSPDASNRCASQGTSVAGVGEGRDGIYQNGGGGGAYGGDGGDGESNYAGGSDYGSALRPSYFGSGGGTSGSSGVGGSGGGVIRINSTDTFNLSGTITVNGGVGGASCSYYAAGGGSGGSIWVTSNVFTGVGNFTADGGAGGNCGSDSGGGGSGGRIAVYFNENSLNSMSASSVTGGSGPNSADDGEEGTLLFVDTDDNNAWIDEGMEFNVTDYASDGSFKVSQNVNFSFNNLTLLGSLLRLEMTGVINVGNFTIIEDTMTFDGDPSETNLSFVYKGGEVWTEDVFNISESFNVNNLTFSDYEMISFKSLTSGYNLTSDTWDADWFDINVANLTIDAESTITTNANGCGNSQSPDDENSCASQGTTVAGVGEGRDGDYPNGAGGAAYGGDGGNGESGYAGGSDYGSALRPTHFGSGGGTSGSSGAGGSGGGVVRINSTDTFNLSGTITTDGTDGAPTCSYYAAGGGSGGSIWVSSNIFMGVGNFSADGGAGGDCGSADGGGGSGGRIAVYFNDSSLNNMSASSVTGGSGPGSATDGEEGTLLFVDTDDNNAWI